MTASLFLPPRTVAINANSRVLAGAKRYFYLAGTNTEATVYTDASKSATRTQPVVASSAGEFPACYVDVAVKVSEYTSEDVLRWTEDNIPTGALTTSEVGAALYPRSAEEIAASITPTAYQYPYGDVRRFGWVAGGSATTNTSALQNALNATPSAGGTVTIPEGVANVSGTIIWPTSSTTLRPITIRGQAGHSVPSSAASRINYTGTGTLFDLRSGTDALTAGQVCIEDLAISGPYSANAKAIVAYDLQGSQFKRLSISGFDVGITVTRYCYYCIFEAVTVTSAKTKGWVVGLLNGTTFDRCRIDAIDTDGPVSGVGIGIDIVSGGVGANFAGCWFENTRTAVKAKDTQQLVFNRCYWESCIFGVYIDTDTSAMNQLVQVTDSTFYHVHNTSSLIFSNDSEDVYVQIDGLGTLQNGGLTDTRIINKTGATPFAQINSILEVTGAKVGLGYLIPWFYNPSFDSAMYPLEFAENDATPSVLNGHCFITTNTAPTTVTNFDDGYRGQFITVLVRDAVTTFDFSSTNLKGNAATDWTAVSGDYLEATFDGTNWNCACFRAVASSVPAYTASNVTPDRSYDANSTTLDEVADVLGTLIADLRAQGIVR